ncbi:hypothetical protein ACFL29_00630 [Patescibacteria group bacterium]
MDLSDAEKKIKSRIQEGSVFYFSDDRFTKDIPHYYVVLNKNPLKDIILILIFATTFDTNRFMQIENSPYPQNTYITLTSKECSILKKPSLFDCNFVLETNVGEIISKFSSGQLKISGEIDVAILDKLRLGVFKSPAVAEKVKKLLK